MSSKRVASPDSNTKGAKKRRIYEQHYRREYTQEWPCIVSSSIDTLHAYCTLCNKNLSVKSGGRDDVKKHTQTKLHKQLSLTVRTTAPLSSFVTTDAETDVTKAEMLFTHFLVEHNLPIAVADHARPLFKEMFADSKVAAKYGCGRTKTTAIIGCLARNTQEELTIALRSAPFAVATDGSNDQNSDCSLYPIVVSYFNVVLGKIVTVLLALGTCTEGSTGVNIFTVVHNELVIKRGISCHNCVAFCSDNASVMMGLHNGVVAHIVKQCPSIAVVGCACHLIHLAAQKAAGELPVDIEDFLVDVY